MFASCKALEKNPSIGEAVVAKSIDRSTLMPAEVSEKFTQSDPAVHFTIKVTDLPKNTNLKVIWRYLSDGTEVTSEKLSSGTHYEVFTLKRSGSKFPPGQYEVTVTGDANGRTLEAKGKFEITAEAMPTHLLNPVTSKGIEGDDKLTPVNITSEFSQEDPVIYYIIQSKDLPENSKVSCTWYYADTGDSLHHELVTGGSRNIAFSLKPDEGKVLPAGKYMVTARVNVNGQTESVTREFELK